MPRVNWHVAKFRLRWEKTDFSHRSTLFRHRSTVQNLVARNLCILCKEFYLLQTFEADLAAPEDERRDVVRCAVKRDVDAKRHIHFGVLHSTAGQSHTKRLRRGRDVAFCGHVQARSVQSLLV